MGGQWISMYGEELLKREDFQRCYGFLITGEGETPLSCLVAHVNGSLGPEEVPNLIYRRGDSWEKSSRHMYEDVKKLPAPDFSGLPLGRYERSLEIASLTFETARGCYW